MAIPAPTTNEITNGNFEQGATGWTLTAFGDGTIAIVASGDAYVGTYCVRHAGTGEASDGVALNNTSYPVRPGKQITLSGAIYPIEGTPGTSGLVFLQWLDANGNPVGESQGNNVNRAGGVSWRQSVVSAAAPAGAFLVKPGFIFNTSSSTSVTSVILGDAMSWNYTYDNAAVITSPVVDALFNSGDTIPLRVTTTGDVTQVIWKVDGATVATLTSAPFSYDTTASGVGSHTVTAEVYFNDNTYITANRSYTVQDAVILTREYRASNSYTYLVGENIANLSSAMPSTAVVTGVEIILDATVDVIVRAKNMGVDDPTNANTNVAFDITNGGTVEATLLGKSGNTYITLGGSIVSTVPIDESDYTVIETGRSEGKLYRHYAGTQQTITLGGETSLFNLGSVDAASFTANAIGLRFYPNLGTKPTYADSGDACFRFMVDSWKIRVYFDAGSVEYYFASPDKTQVIKAEVAAVNITEGSLRTSDASGVLQLTPEFEIMDGSQTWIGDDWTIHSFYPPTDTNQIGEVAGRTLNDGIGMSYNYLPGYWQVEDNRSRYMFITANFYGDESLDSIYGANGVDRAFAYNGNFFYKIQTQPELEKDKPRHVAFHHTHLALGYKEGRVDISVVGEPYNFEGNQGASSWAIGDSVVGLTSLSGAILGVFCSKSIVGISGTTVDNFATQTLSPNIGAIEYTVADMGFPVYANAYGIYTLAQTSQYGDYMGSPMSQPISPWLRPRLIRKMISPKEVVVAWPVRSKNQYRLSFADGYVLSMTMNYGTQSAPTFSKQKYFITEEDVMIPEGTDLFEYPAIVPSAISSELDDSGEERIHISNKQEEPTITPIPPEPFITYAIDNGIAYSVDLVSAFTGFVAGDEWQFVADNLANSFSSGEEDELGAYYPQPTYSYIEQPGTVIQGGQSWRALISWYYF